MTKLPTYSKGNTKLGKCLIVSRAVGDTCTPDCPMARDCYARFTERRFKHVRRCGLENANIRTREIKALLKLARQRKVPIRLHERGDFGNGKRQQIDKRYVRAIELGLQQSNRSVKVWTYTHIYHKRLASLSSLGLSIYASVHNSHNIKLATNAGFKLFVTVLPERPNKVKPWLKPITQYSGPQTLIKYRRRWIVCPAQYNVRGNETIKCIDCRICIDGLANIAFLRH